MSSSRAGVTKINISTALKQAYMKSALEYLAGEATNKWEPIKSSTDHRRLEGGGHRHIFHSAARVGPRWAVPG